MKRIVVTGATGQIAYSLLFHLARGDLFGNEEPIALHLCDVPGTEAMMEGLAMELEDCAFPLLAEVKTGSDLSEQFENVDLALLVGAKPRGPGMERADLLRENGKIFVAQGRALNDSANKNVKVVVVGNPCNTNCLIAMRCAPSIPRKNFHAMMRLDQNRAEALLAKKASLSVAEVKRMTIWGNHSATQVPDFMEATLTGKKTPEVIDDLSWLQGEFIETVQKRGAAIIAARGKSSAASAAYAAFETVRALYTPTPEGEWFSSAVCSDGNPYGIENNLIFGFPCRSGGDGDYEIVADIPWDFFIKEKIALTQKELISERACIEKELL
ncbi:MAG: malate dehydrogenase [Chlamydiales bacterium]|nr:malate dehydrogenase [Chlamydiales bacterium]